MEREMEYDWGTSVVIVIAIVAGFFGGRAIWKILSKPAGNKAESTSHVHKKCASCGWEGMVSKYHKKCSNCGAELI
jgi:hypothetical protein